MVWFQDRLLASIDKKFLEDILAQYNLGPVKFWKPVSGFENLGIVVETGKGKFLIKFYRPSKSVHDLEFELAVAEHLRKLSLPVAEVLTDRSGEKIRYQIIGKLTVPAVAFQFLKGEQKILLENRQIELVGQLLAKIHSAFASFSFWQKIPRPVFDYAKRFRILQDFFARLTNFEVLRLWKDFLPEFTRTLAENKDLLAYHQLIFADLHQANLIFKDSRITGLFDFGKVGLGPKLADLAIFVGNYYIINREKGNLAQKIDQVSQLFLTGYQNQIGSIKADILPNLIKFWFFEKAKWAISQLKFGSRAWHGETVLNFSTQALAEEF